MSWTGLTGNQMVTFTDAQSGGFTLNAGQSAVSTLECMTKSQALTKYNLDTASMSAYANNQLVPKSAWVNGIVNDASCVINPGWVTTNATHTTFTDGTVIRQVTSNAAWEAGTTAAWCYYNNDPALGAIYGKLYNWYAVAGIFDAASSSNPGLRKSFVGNETVPLMVPTDYEWSTLTTCLGGGGAEGGKMKETGTAHWNSPNTSATNSSGFTGLPGGGRNILGSFQDIGNIGAWWSANESVSGTANAYFLLYNDPSLISSYGYKNQGFSVRLIVNPYT